MEKLTYIIESKLNRIALKFVGECTVEDFMALIVRVKSDPAFKPDMDMMMDLSDSKSDPNPYIFKGLFKYLESPLNI